MWRNESSRDILWYVGTMAVSMTQDAPVWLMTTVIAFLLIMASVRAVRLQKSQGSKRTAAMR